MTEFPQGSIHTAWYCCLESLRHMTLNVHFSQHPIAVAHLADFFNAGLGGRTMAAFADHPENLPPYTIEVKKNLRNDGQPQNCTVLIQFGHDDGDQLWYEFNPEVWTRVRMRYQRKAVSDQHCPTCNTLHRYVVWEVRPINRDELRGISSAMRRNSDASSINSRRSQRALAKAKSKRAAGECLQQNGGPSWRGERGRSQKCRTMVAEIGTNDALIEENSEHDWKWWYVLTFIVNEHTRWLRLM